MKSMLSIKSMLSWTPLTRLQAIHAGNDCTTKESSVPRLVAVLRDASLQLQALTPDFAHTSTISQMSHHPIRRAQHNRNRAQPGENNIHFKIITMMICS